jgi:hypothetical protein
MKKLALLIMIVLSTALKANIIFQTVDKTLDSIDPIDPYNRLSMVIQTEVEPNGFTADGCSGEISKVWTEQIYPKYIKPKLGGASDEFVNFPVESCCIQHDASYHRAYFKNNESDDKDASTLNALELKMNRKEADLKFRECVAQKENKAKFVKAFRAICLPKDATESEILAKDKKLEGIVNLQQIADLMYAGVRFGGRPCSNHEYRFGYGYGNCENSGTSTLDTSLKVLLDLLNI